MNSSALAALRAYARGPTGTVGQPEHPEQLEDERCDLCGAAVPGSHAHVVELATRALRCACPACAALGHGPGGRATSRVERRVVRLSDGIDEAGWAALGIPIGLAYIVRWSQDDEVVATFPGAGGVTAAPLDGGVWAALGQRIPALARLRPDVEALLVHRLAGRRQQLVVSIDLCHELLGRIRGAAGRGGSGAVAAAIDEFFATLAEERHG